VFMRNLTLAFAAMTLILLIGCASHDIVSEIKTSDVDVSQNFTFNKLINADNINTGEKTNNPDTDDLKTTEVPEDNNTKETETPEDTDDKDENSFVPAIPSANNPKSVLVDLDYVYALVNGDVITSKDIQKDLINYIEHLSDIRKNMSSSPFDLEGLGSYRSMLKEAELNALYRNFERKMLEILFEHKADDLKMYLGSVPEESIQAAIEDSKRQHGIYGDDEASNKRWREILASNNLTYLEFREQIINQLNQQRTLWLISAHPDFRIDITLDITPRELREEYLRLPVSDISNVELYRVEVPIMSSNTDAAYEKVLQYRTEIETMLGKTDAKDIEEKFKQITKAIYPFWKPKREKLAQLNDEEPQVIYEINNATQLPKLCQTIEMDDKLVMIFLLKKEQKGFAKFSSMLVQVELFRRLQNILWNEFRERYSKILIREATIIPGDLVSPK